MSLLATVNGRGVLASRPAAAAANEGYIYYATDSGSGSLFRSNGSSWDTYSSAGLADQGTITYLDATGAAAPGNPAAGKARIYAKADGRIYSRNPAGVEYGPFDVAGGGAGAFNGYAVDKPPASAHAKDDEFTGSTLDAKWTNPVTSAVGASIVSFSDGALTLTTPASGIHVAGIRQSAPAGSFSVLASVIYAPAYVFDIRCGVFVMVAGGKGHVVGPKPQDGDSGVIGVTTASTTADWSTYDGYLNGVGSSSSRIARPRIRWTTADSTLRFDYWNGQDWVLFASRAGMAQPTHIGVCIYGNGVFGSATPSIMVDWFRVTEP